MVTLIMGRDLLIEIIENDDDLLDIVPLKQADDSECMSSPISEDLALKKIIRIKEYGSDFWIAKYRQIPVGYAIGTVQGESYRSEGIYVTPDYRGKEIGPALEQAQIEFAKNLNCDEIFSNVADLNEVSKSVQEKAGFRFEPSGAGYIVRLSLK